MNIDTLIEVINSESFIIGLSLGTLLTVIFALLRMYFAVPEGHRALVTHWGKLKKDSAGHHICYQPGAYFKWPWELPHIFSIMEKNIELAEINEKTATLAKDGTLLILNAKVRVRPIEDSIESLLFRIAKPFEHIREFYSCLLKNEIANYGEIKTSDDYEGSFSQIRKNRRLLNHKMEEACRIIKSKNYGVEFLSVDLTDINPPPELDEALNAMQAAQSQADTKYARAEAESLQRVTAAKRNIEIKKLRAEAMLKTHATTVEFLKKLIETNCFDKYLHHRQIEMYGDLQLRVLKSEGKSL